MIPEFNDQGNLPEGIHDATWQEFTQRFGYNSKRLWLLDGLGLLIQNLKAAGCEMIYIDGSFVTEKVVPGDYDMAWSIKNVDPNKLDSCLLYGQPSDRDTITKKYRGDVFPGLTHQCLYFEQPHTFEQILFIQTAEPALVGHA